MIQTDWVISFLAIVDEGGFAAAAASLPRSQSRVSAHIAALEKAVNAQLFERSRPTHLTQAGRAFLTYARAVKSNLEGGVAAVAALNALAEGEVALGVYPSAGAMFVPPLLAEFSKRFPRIKIELVEQAIFGLDDALINDRVALAIRPLLPPIHVPGTHYRLLWQEPIKIVVHPEHEFAHKEFIPIADLRNQSLIITGYNLRHDTEAFELLSPEGLEPKVSYVSDQPQSLVGLVAAGLGVGFTNQLALESIRTDRVRIIDPEPPMDRKVGVYWKGNLQDSPNVAALVAQMMELPVPSGTKDIRGANDLTSAVDVDEA